MERVHGVSGKVCWGVGGGEGSCVVWEGVWGVWGKLGRCREVSWGVGGGKERYVGSGKVWESGEVC